MGELGCRWLTTMYRQKRYIVFIAKADICSLSRMAIL
jgi:hypothetical protein